MSMSSDNLLISWHTRGQGEANTETVFSLTAAPCNGESFPSWLLGQCQQSPTALRAVADSVILALKPSCQRVAKDSLNRTLTGDFTAFWNSFLTGAPARSKYLELSEATAIADVLIEYWINESSNATKPMAIRDTAKALLIGALTNKPPKGANALVLAKVREAWNSRLTANGVEVPPALIPVSVDAIDADAF